MLLQTYLWNINIISVIFIVAVVGGVVNNSNNEIVVIVAIIAYFKAAYQWSHSLWRQTPEVLRLFCFGSRS